MKRFKECGRHKHQIAESRDHISELHEFIPRLDTLIAKPPKLNFEYYCEDETRMKLVKFI